MSSVPAVTPTAGRHRLRSLILLFVAPAILASGDLGAVVVSQPPLPPIKLSSEVASWYHLPGMVTASGEPYDSSIAANKTAPINSQWTLCREDHPLVCVSVIVKDRGPWIKGRDWDLGKKAARKLGMIKSGLCRVTARRM